MTMGRETGMDLTMETNGSEASSSMVIGTHDNSNTTPLNSKRQRLEKSRIENSYPRKRALRACQVCRARKTKCNNEKPVCGCCQALGAQCVYDETNSPYTLDFASQIIVERLDQVLQKLDEREVDSAETLRRISQELGTFQSEKVSLRSRWQAPATNGEGLGSERDHELQLDENMLTPSARTSPDAVLDWPVFESQYPTGFITRHLFDQNFFDDSRPEESEHDVSQPSAFINEEAVPQLVEIFLTRVHTKSPILDPKTAREFGFKIALEGLQWDASSCLVLIMCALGCVSQPLGDSHNRILPDNRMETSRSVLGEQDLSLGSAYFTAARKRIGLLKPSVIATQCIFLCGVYEMYMVHPLRAWNFFADASSNFFMYLKCEESHFGGDISRTKSPETQCIEASLYWSCYKSMCELRTEVPLPPSVLSQVNYAHSLPEPPTSFASVNDSRQEVSEVGFEILQEQAWFFYLSDIIISRLGTRVLLNLYDNGYRSWNVHNLRHMIKAADEFERQLNEWHASLPEQIQFNDSIETDHELRFTLRTRAMEVKAWLYRPFLYYIIHQIIHQSSSKVPERVRQLAQKAIDGSIHWILLRHNRHRHHGSWFVGRLILSSALSILAAVKAKLRLDSLDNWKEIVLEAITTMKFWADESSDFAVGSVVLEKLFSQLLDISND
ncbi:hypothetical protein sscle_10g079170 [Sclerotinia sclerotiorum 1980 UF-70]|uniref:Zn(2)-C6 fungal-type domain-containing protein n=1 Tax=Sclerotinia sclerotiorum (strain ATCC 18683 / 1980 / Ss-1) TaxID=665079 RepID=A0A1D9QDY6_SCLS1|nr:hypothetical protein sscle_10g079170 [Sclerotinia sclerotiorum 1980 UF-70]